MNKTIFINGGFGRMVCAIPALERFITNHPESYIITEGGIDIALGNTLLHDRTYDLNTKGLFENIIKSTELIYPEPYFDYDYYNQRINIAQAFDKIINGSIRDDCDYRANIIFNKQELTVGEVVCFRAKEHQNKPKVIVIQPFGRSSDLIEDLDNVVDPSSRSLKLSTYLQIVKELKKQYTVISMSDFKIPNNIAFEPENISIREWGSVIKHADYFIGCDSAGQHLAYAVDTPGTVILGSSFAENVTYPNYFNIIEKQGFNKRYSPIRISHFNSFEADQLNGQSMEFDETETQNIIYNILADIKAKL